MKEENLAKPILRRLFEGSHLSGVRFGYFSELLFREGDKHQTPIFGQIYLNFASSWALLDAVPSVLPNSEDDFPKYSEEMQKQLLSSLINLEIVKVELGNKQPHLILTFENDKVLIVNGIDYSIECWQAGVAFNSKESCQIIASPGGKLAVWDAKTFSY